MRCASFLIVARRVLSIAFWSAARLLDGFFLCSIISNIQIACLSHSAHLWFLSLLEECLLSLLLLTSLPCKVFRLSYLINLLLINTGQIDFVRCSDDIAGIDTAERNTVDLEWASDEENTLFEGFQENDTLATETTSEEDENSARSKSWSGSRGSDGFADLN